MGWSCLSVVVVRPPKVAVQPYIRHRTLALCLNVKIASVSRNDFENLKLKADSKIEAKNNVKHIMKHKSYVKPVNMKHIHAR